MTSPYLELPKRSLEQVLRERHELNQMSWAEYCALITRLRLHNLLSPPDEAADQRPKRS